MKVLRRPPSLRVPRNGNVVRLTYKAMPKREVEATVSGRGLSLSDFKDGSRGGVVDDSSTKAKTVWKIPGRLSHMSAVSSNVLRPHLGLSRDLLAERSFALRTRPNRQSRPKVRPSLLFRINAKGGVGKVS